MNEKLAAVINIMKKSLLWFFLPLGLVLFCFVLGEQFEVGRLSAIASCEGSLNNAACIRSKGYLAEAPHYPDLGRRYFGGFARFIGGDLGASYREESKLQAITIAEPKSEAEDSEDEVSESKQKPQSNLKK